MGYVIGLRGYLEDLWLRSSGSDVFSLFFFTSFALGDFGGRTKGIGGLD